ncbi:MAG: DUF4340 domain-containing protein [Phycisphaera sp.]|nr:DUF4340 domain-containing protein [Phycisphaera sp.]
MRHMRLPIALILAVAFGVLAWKAPRESTEATRARTALLSTGALDPENLAEVVVEREGVRHRFERRGELWWQTEPVVHAADGWSVRQLAVRALKLESVRSVAAAAPGAGEGEGQGLAEVGLDPPLARVTFVERARAGEAARTTVFELGRRSLAGRAFARLAPATPSAGYEVVDGVLHDFVLDRDPREFRSRDLFAGLGEVDRVELSSAGVATVLRREGRSYRLDGVVRTRADRERAEELVDALRRARSAGFIVDRPAELAAYGLAPPAATLSVTSGGVPASLLIGDPVSIGAQDRFGLVEGTSTVVRVPAESLVAMVPRVDRLVDPTGTGARASDVGGLEIVRGAERIELRREVSGWTARRSDADGSTRDGAVDAATVERLLTALCETRASAIEVAPFPSDRAIATVTLRGFAGEAIDTVRIATRSDPSGAAGVAFENGDGVLRMHGAIELPLSPAELGFKPKPAAP